MALLALDARRISQRRCDAAPCIRLPASLMYGQEGREGHAGESGQSGQPGEPLVEGSSGEMPVSTQPMHREDTGASPAGTTDPLRDSLLFSVDASRCGSQVILHRPISHPLKSIQESCSAYLVYPRAEQRVYRVLQFHSRPTLHAGCESSAQCLARGHRLAWHCIA